MADHKPYKLVANNKKAYHDYFIEEKYECGIELFGTEVKSIRMGKCSIKEAYVAISGGQAYIEGMNISPYEKGNIFNREPLRRRRLLLHKVEAVIRECILLELPAAVDPEPLQESGHFAARDLAGLFKADIQLRALGAVRDARIDPDAVIAEDINALPLAAVDQVVQIEHRTHLPNVCSPLRVKRMGGCPPVL